MMASFAEGGAILQRSDYLDAARRNARFVLANLQRDGLLLRSYKDGKAKLNAYLEDYAFLIEGLITLSETSGELSWLLEALRLADRMIEEFWDSDNGGFFFTGKSHETLIVRQKDYFDNATPSGNSVAANALLRLATLTDNEDYRNRAVTVLREVADSARRYPSGFGYALSTVDFYLSTPKEIALVGDDDANKVAFLSEVWRPYLPNKVVAGAKSSDHPDSTPVVLLPPETPLRIKHWPTSASGTSGKAPTATPAELRQQLENL
jgi:uncharacterized protein YyaL (SSP411 family)